MEHGEVPHQDPFSFTAHGLPWHGVSWLSDLIYYGGFAAAGTAGVVLLKAVAAALAIALVGQCARALGATRPSAAVAMLVFAVVHQGRGTTARPETWAVVLLALALLLTVREVRSRQGAASYMPLLAFVWVQVHTSAVLAPVVLGAGALAQLVTRERMWRRTTLLTLATAAVFALPQGRDVLRAVAMHRASVSPVAMRITDEWQRPVLASSAAVVPLALAIAAMAASALMLWRTRSSSSVLALLVSLLGLALWLAGARNRGLLALLCAPALSVGIDLAGRWLARRGLSLLGRLAPVTGVFLAVLEVSLGPALQNRLAFGFDFSERFPSDTVAVLETLPRARVLSDYHYGGYLLWRGFPSFWDGRNVTLYPDEMLRDLFIPAASNVDGMLRAERQLDLRYAIVDADGMFVDVLMSIPEWVVLSVGRKSALMVSARQVDAVRAATGREPYALLRYDADGPWIQWYFGQVLRDPVRRAALHSEVVRAARSEGASWLIERIIDAVESMDPTFVDPEMALWVRRP